MWMTPAHKNCNGKEWNTGTDSNERERERERCAELSKKNNNMTQTA